jgi:hypothetical protein
MQTETIARLNSHPEVGRFYTDYQVMNENN